MLSLQTRTAHNTDLTKEDKTTADSMADMTSPKRDAMITQEGTTEEMTDAMTVDVTPSEVTSAIGDMEEYKVTHDKEVPPRITSTKSMSEIAMQMMKSTGMMTKGTINGRMTNPVENKEGPG
jgi:hypothetical protein